MPISTIANGASSATARAAINAAITQLNGSSAPIVTPNVIHVAAAPVGNDDTGDGTLPKPYRTGTRAFLAYQTANVPASIEFGVGTFEVIFNSYLPQPLSFRGQSVTTTSLLITSREYDVDVIAADLTLSIMADGLTGQNGANGLNDDDPNGQPGEPGGNGRNVNVKGRCWVRDVDISGGNGGNGGNGTASFPSSVGGLGRDGGNKGSLNLQVDKLIGVVTASQGLGGGGGTGQSSNGNPGTDGSAAAATLIFDSCDLRPASLPQPEIILSRCLYLTSQALTVTDRGGNAVE